MFYVISPESSTDPSEVLDPVRRHTKWVAVLNFVWSVKCVRVFMCFVRYLINTEIVRLIVALSDWPSLLSERDPERLWDYRRPHVLILRQKLQLQI